MPSKTAPLKDRWLVYVRIAGGTSESSDVEPSDGASPLLAYCEYGLLDGSDVHSCRHATLKPWVMAWPSALESSETTPSMSAVSTRGPTLRLGALVYALVLSPSMAGTI